MEHLHEQHAKGLLHYLRRLTGNDADARDCLQGCFTILQERGGECAAGARRAWLFRVAYTEAMQLLRRRRRMVESADPIERADREGSSPTDQVIRTEQLSRAREELERLPPELQDIVRLRIEEDLKFREIAERLDVPLGTVLGRMTTAIDKLGRRLRN